MREARATLCWQFGQDRLDRLNPCLIHNKREQIRVWKITVIVRKLLATHGTGHFSVRIPQAGFLDDPAAGLDDLGLALNLVLNRLFYCAKRIEILDFRSGAELRIPVRTYGHIGVATQTAFFHIAITDLNILENSP